MKERLPSIVRRLIWAYVAAAAAWRLYPQEATVIPNRWLVATIAFPRFIRVNIDKHQHDVWAGDELHPAQWENSRINADLIIDTHDRVAWLGGESRPLDIKTKDSA